PRRTVSPGQTVSYNRITGSWEGEAPAEPQRLVDPHLAARLRGSVALPMSFHLIRTLAQTVSRIDRSKSAAGDTRPPPAILAAPSVPAIRWMIHHRFPLFWILIDDCCFAESVSSAAPRGQH